MTAREDALRQIRENINQHGHHVYLISGGPDPRFAYTIGLTDAIGAELVLAGASFYSKDECLRVINDAAAKLRSGAAIQGPLTLPDGTFSLQKADASWVKLLLLGASDFYDPREIQAVQIMPDKDHWTIDTPDLSQAWTVLGEPPWRWLQESWSETISSKSIAVTNLAALRGEVITEAARWEESEWELFAGAGPDISEDDIRLVPLATLLAADESLKFVVNLPLGGALWRDLHGEWHDWERKADAPQPPAMT